MSAPDQWQYPGRDAILAEQVAEILNPLGDDEALAAITDGRLARELGGIVSVEVPSIIEVVAAYMKARWNITYGHRKAEATGGPDRTLMRAISQARWNFGGLSFAPLEGMVIPRSAKAPKPAPKGRSGGQQMDLEGGA